MPNPYRYTWHYESETDQEIDSWTLYLGGHTIEDIKQATRDASLQAMQEGLEQRAAELGLPLEIESLDVTVTHSENVDMWGRYWYRIQSSGDAVFVSSEDYMSSPVALALMIVLKWIIQAITIILVAYIVTEAIGRWLETMTVKKSTITKKTTLPDGTVIEETEELTEPNMWGAIGVGIMLAILLIGGAGAIKLYRHKEAED